MTCLAWGQPIKYVQHDPGSYKVKVHFSTSITGNISICYIAW